LLFCKKNGASHNFFKETFLKKNTGKMMLGLKLYFALINFEKPLFGGQ